MDYRNKLTARFSVCCENCTNLVVYSCNSIIVRWNWRQELWTGKWEVVCKFFSVSAIDKLFKHVLQIRKIKRRCDWFDKICNNKDGEDWTNFSDIWIITRCWGAGLYSICTYILYVPIFYMYLYSICTFILYVPILYTYLHSIHTLILYVPTFYTYLYSIGTYILYIPIFYTYPYSIRTHIL